MKKFFFPFLLFFCSFDIMGADKIYEPFRVEIVAPQQVELKTGLSPKWVLSGIACLNKPGELLEVSLFWVTKGSDIFLGVYDWTFDRRAVIDLSTFGFAQTLTSLYSRPGRNNTCHSDQVSEEITAFDKDIDPMSAGKFIGACSGDTYDFIPMGEVPGAVESRKVSITCL